MFLAGQTYKLEGERMKLIMVVDDEEDNRNTLKMILEKNGYKVVLAVNGDDCLKKLEKAKPDLILLDIMMPGIPSLEVVKKVKGIKIAFLSVVRMTEAEKENLLDKKVVAFIQKPFDIEDLLSTIKKII